MDRPLWSPAWWDHLYSTLESRLSPRRLHHCIGVGHFALRLARKWNIPAEEALAAGLLHDIAKEEPPARQRELLKAELDWADPDDDEHSAIWHAVAGAVLAREEFGLSVSAANAIRLHPTGDSPMTGLEQILFVSDYIEPGRRWEGARELRVLALEDLDEAVREVALMKTAHVESRRKPLHPRSLRVRAAAKGVVTI